MKCFAIVPAAGRSQRMGTAKLLLPWGDSTILESVLAAWLASAVSRVVVVVHPADQEIADRSAAAGAEVVRPSDPPGEMKESVRIALAYLKDSAPRSTDAWLVAPADMPGLNPRAIDAVIRTYEASLPSGGEPAIWVPRHEGRAGHPVLFPWRMAEEVARLAPAESLKSLFARHAVHYLDTAEPVAEDVDTLADYERLRPSTVAAAEPTRKRQK